MFSRLTLVLAVFFFMLASLAVNASPARAQDHLLFCNDPEKIRMPGTYADAMLIGGQTYTIFFHYKNATTAGGKLVLALSGSEGEPLTFTARKGFADPRRDPPTVGQQAMARFLSAPEKPYVGQKGFAQFAQWVGSKHIASGVLSVRCEKDTRLRIYWRHNKWAVPGSRVVAVDTPRREVDIALSKPGERKTFRIGVPEEGMSRHLDGTYGMLYAFKVVAPAGRKVRVSFSPRGGKGGLVGSLDGALRQTQIVPAARWKVFCEAKVGQRGGINLTTAPFGGVFYPVELVFQLI